jgi:DNA-binding response OmpR family regulator
MNFPLEGRRILVVEDELMIAMLLENLLEDEQCTVIGPFARVAAALKAANAEAVDFALLDVNVANEKIYPVAELLERRGIPFLLLSGYGQQALPPNGLHWPVCSKPFKITEVVQKMTRMLARRH